MTSSHNKPPASANQIPSQAPGQLPNHVLDRVLAGLRDTEAPPHLSQTILRTLAQRPTPAPRWRRFTAGIFRPLPTAAATAVLIALLGTGYLFLRTHNVPPRELGLPLNTAHRVLPPSLAVPQAHAGLSATSGPRHATAWPPKTAASAHQLPPQPAALDPQRALALAETRAPSQPTPAQPLTEQEQLLLRIAHRRDPVEIAALDPTTRAAHNAAEKAAVQQFFTPSTPAPTKETTP